MASLLDSGTAPLPARVVPPARPLGRLAFIRTFLRNPLEAIPQAVYEEDFVRLGSDPDAVWITAPAAIKSVLLDERDKFRKLAQVRLLGPMLGKGLLTAEGADWKWQRQAAAPMFRPTELAGFVPAFVRAAQATLERWRAAPPGTAQEIDADMTRATFDVVSATLLPSPDDAFAHEVQLSMKSLQRFGAWDIFYARLGLPYWMPRPGGMEKRRAVRELRASVRQRLGAIGRARDAGGAPPDDLMQRLLLARDPETGRAMDEERLADNLLTFYLAGHETTAKALTWTLYLVARSPEWAARLAEEVARVTEGGCVTAAHVERLVLVQQVLRESMRLYPPVPIMSRQSIAAASIGGHPVRKGSNVLIPIYAIHRHAKRWERPDAFEPERFAPAREAAMPRYQYMPFGAGPRICIGMSFAMIEAAAILATLVQGARFATLPGGEPQPVANVTLLPKGGMRLAVSLR